ncbi:MULTISPECIES: DUF4241 domain-containing protein [Amniculibacterium]|uniref:DUF4241 domain-containing protein n=1 Tax=Amniculibacterium TaxID=2715289 RepID=UPI000F5AF6ED|nr:MULTISPECIES: DUF4241 domain-containing protein [Amniculibacterium]
MNHLDNIKKLFSKNFVENPLIESFDAGKLHLPTGQLLACDPLLTNDMKPFTVNFPKGDHHVIVHQEKDSHGIAYVEVVFSDEVCQSWQMAVTEGQNLKDLKKGEIFGFPVASGMGSFMDAETQNELNALEEKLFQEKQDDFLGIYEEFFHNAFFEGEKMIRNYAFLKPNPSLHNSIFAFEIGETEGFFASYIGFDAQDRPVKIIMELIEIGEG